MSKLVTLIVAADNAGGIGHNDSIPWDLSKDKSHFRTTTTKASEGKMNAVIMGRKTYFSIPQKYRPLRQRKNIVITRQPSVYQAIDQSVTFCASLEEAIKLANDDAIVEKIFIAGGGEIYKQALNSSLVDEISLTKIESTFDCNVFIPAVDRTKYEMIRQSVKETAGDPETTFYFVQYKKI